MTWLNIASIALLVGCVITTIAFRLRYRKQTTELKQTMVGAVDAAYKRGHMDGYNQSVNRTFYAIVQSIDSGCDVTDIREGLVNGYIPIQHRDRKVDA